jgi:glycosyltransferase involved in cell wall biosynthesis
MVARPLVSVIVNNYNYGNFVAESIASALGQTYSRIEVIVVDDGSTDDSRSIIGRFGRDITPVFKQNEGQASTFNAGFEVSSGEVVIFLDADDYLLPGAAQRAVDVLSACDAVKVHWPLWEVTESGRRTGNKHPRHRLVRGCWREHIIRHGPVSLPQPPTSGNAWSRSLLEDLLPLPEHEDKHGADGFLRKLAPLFGEMQTISEPQACYRVHPNNYGGGRGLLFQFRRALKRYPLYCELAAARLNREGFSIDPIAWQGPDSEYAWLQDAVGVHDEIESRLPSGACVVLLDDDVLGPDLLPHSRVLSIWDGNGVNGQSPQDAQHVVAEVARLREQGAQFLLIAFPAFWWFDSYPGLREALTGQYPCIEESSRLVAFDLQTTKSN